MTGVEQLIKEATELCKKIEALANELLVSRLPKEVTTRAEVDALPPGTIVRLSDGSPAYRGTGSWVSTGEGAAYDLEDRIVGGVVLSAGKAE